MEHIETVRAELEALTKAVSDSLDPESQPTVIEFFATILVAIRRMQDEVDLINLFFELSTTAFRGFTLTDDQSASIDALLEAAENIASAMSAPSDNMH